MLTLAQKFYRFLAGIKHDEPIDTIPRAQSYFDEEAGARLLKMSDEEFEESLKRIMPDHVIVYCEPDKKKSRARRIKSLQG